MSRLTHLDDNGAAHMVDVGDKAVTQRVAVAGGTVVMRAETLAMIQSGGHAKGDVLAVARIAGIQAAKKCADLIPLCHPLMLSAVDVRFLPQTDTPETGTSVLRIEATCKVAGKTGVEMEALTAVSVAALTVYDMCKSVDRGMRIDAIALISKEGGRSGEWRRQPEAH